MVDLSALPDWLAGAGDGDGDGYGDGYGYGDGAGDGAGAGAGYAWIYRFQSAAQAWPEEQRARLAAAEKTADVLALWKSNKHGKPANGGRDDKPAEPGLLQEIAGPLKICQRGLHATMDPDDWKGDRLWVVALYGEIQQEGQKFAALRREIIGEIPL